MIHKFIELLAALLLGLLAILVPIFAVMISVSARAIEEGRRGLEQNIKGIFTDIDEIRKKSAESAETAIKELKKAIRKYSWQKRRAQIQLFLLTTRAAIYYPGLLFLGSLGLLLAPLSKTTDLPRSDSLLLYSACGLAVIGTALLCGVLETVSKFASTYDPPVAGDAPDFSVTFENNTGVSVWPEGSAQQCRLTITNKSDYLGETIQVAVFTPPQLQLKNTTNFRVVPQGPHSKYSGYNALFWDINRLHARTSSQSPQFEVVAPAEKGEYVLPARIVAAKIRLINTELKAIVN